MYLGKRKAERDQAKVLEEQRQKVIAFKRFFGEEHGRAVMLDLMNKYYVLNPLPTQGLSEFERGIAEGKRQAVLYILGLANTDMAALDKILKGDFA